MIATSPLYVHLFVVQRTKIRGPFRAPFTPDLLDAIEAALALAASPSCAVYVFEDEVKLDAVAARLTEGRALYPFEECLARITTDRVSEGLNITLKTRAMRGWLGRA